MSYQYPPFTCALIVENADAAIAFYKKAFGATERFRLTDPQTQGVGHAEIEVLGHVIFLEDRNPQWGSQSPTSLGGTTAKLVLTTKDTDAIYKQAIESGAISVMEPADMFYGCRMAVVRDPFGHEWMINHEIEKVSPEEMQQRWSDMCDTCCGDD